MKTFKLFLLMLGCILTVCFTGSCGYHMGSMMHPQINSIAIAEIRNDTKEPLLSAIMRQQLAEQVQFDGSLKLVDKEKADCILYCHISGVNTVMTREDTSDGSRSYNPSEFMVTVNGEFTVVIPGRSEPLIPKRGVSGSARYQTQFDPQVYRTNGLKLACLNFARLAVQYTTEAW